MNAGESEPSRRRLWLVRHGESAWNALGLVQGQARAPGLSDAGTRQARRCARRLAGEPVGALYASDLDRAVETARPISQSLGVPVVLEPRLRERSLGVAEGKPSELLSAELSGVFDRHVVDADAAPPGGESVRDLYSRVGSCIEEVLSREVAGDVVLVCHGGVIRAALAWLDGTGPDGMAWPDVGNGFLMGREMQAASAAGDRRDTVPPGSLGRASR